MYGFTLALLSAMAGSGQSAYMWATCTQRKCARGSYSQRATTWVILFRPYRLTR